MSVMRARRLATLGCTGLFSTIVISGCLARPVGSHDPTTKASVTKALKQSSVDKVDLLVLVDNSSSMGDKQAYLREAIPDLVKRLVQPGCVDDQGGAPVPADANGQCGNGKKLEFQPVHDMHIGILSSSLGARLGDLCDPNDKRVNHNDDRAHLLNRAGDDEHAQAVMGTANYLAFLPPVAENANKPMPTGSVAITDPNALVSAFQDAVSGVHQNGCGIESQLEAFYRFMIQPDPYDQLKGSGGASAWFGVDGTILSQRKAFLRPDSLMVVLDLTDENDSEIDVRSLGGQSNAFMRASWQPPRATSICAVNPLDPSCTSCSALVNPGSDPSCATSYTQSFDWGFDPNLRHVHMKQKYGVDPQYPISRYAHGLTSKRVPNRDGEYPAGSHRYIGDDKCTNPLFAAELPDGSRTDVASLCDLPLGPRTADMIYFAHIGGVPSALLHDPPNDPKHGKLDAADWQKILGADPERLDTTGIDPHMIESYAPRQGLPAPTDAFNADPISGRESITDANGRVDLQYACTFPLTTPRTCADNDYTCDCTNAVGRPTSQVPSVCNPGTPNVQSRAKAYPTVRELLLAKKLGEQGIVSSICPTHVTEQSPGDPLYGYRPAMSAIVDRLKTQLGEQCLPEPLTLEGGSAPCLVIEELPSGTTSCAQVPGLSPLAPEIRKRFDAQRLAADPELKANELPLACELAQVTSADASSCEASSDPGWCYVLKTRSCSQAIRFSKTGSPAPYVKLSLQCLALQ